MAHKLYGCLLLLLQVVYALGPVAGRLPEGGFGYIDNMTPERVEAQGKQTIFSNDFFDVYSHAFHDATTPCT
jgi:hypothetical protein